MTDLRDPIFHDDEAARLHLEAQRWPNGPYCPRCGEAEAVTRLQGKSTAPGLCVCRSCRTKFSVTMGTIFERSHIPLSKWMLGFRLMASSKKGVSALQLQRTLDLKSYKSAWFMAHRIREAMKRRAPGSLVGTIVADETWIGADPKRMNKGAKASSYKLRMTPHVDRPHGGTDKTPVLSLINADTGEVRSAVVPKVDGTNLRKVIAEQVDMAGSVLWTDEGSWYNQIGKEFQAHETVNHSIDEYVDWITGASTNKLENYFSQLKRSIDGTHHRVSVEHLPRYLAEFDYRYTTCKMDDTRRVERLMGQVDRRLSYKRTKAR